MVSLIAALSLHEAKALKDFPIATNTAIEFTFGGAFDGSNCLVSLQTGSFYGGQISLQFIPQSGPPLPAPIPIGEWGFMPLVAFGGTNYFVVWSGSDTNPGLRGRFISKSGGLGDSNIVITTVKPRTFSLGSGGGKYLVCWSDDSTIRGQFVNSDGTRLSPTNFPISGAVLQARENAIAFNGTNFFVVFNGSGAIRSNIWGQFASPPGVTNGDPWLINDSTEPCDNPLAVVFDGTNYFVVFNEEVGGYGGAFHVFGRLVSASGEVRSDRITIANGPGAQHFPFMAFDGTNHLVVWSQGTDVTNLDLTLRFFDKSGQPVGPEFSPFPIQGTNRPAFGGPLFDGQKYLVAATLANLTNGFNAASADVYGVFLPRLPRLDVTGPLVNSQLPLRLSGTPSFDYVIQATTNLPPSQWMSLVTNSPTNGAFNFIDSHATNSSRFYRAVVQ